MRNNNVINDKSVKHNNYKNHTVYCLPFGLGFVSYTHNGFNLNGYKFNFKYKDSALLQLFGYGISKTIKGVLEILNLPKLQPISSQIKRND